MLQHGDDFFSKNFPNEIRQGKTISPKEKPLQA
jgi:hypothetical protein